MDPAAQKQRIRDFLKTQMLGVVATVDASGKPEAAVVGFSEFDTLELVFGTFVTTRKYQNLKADPHVAFVIGWDDVTVQYEGLAAEVTGDELNRCRNRHLEKAPNWKNYIFDPQERFFRITPTWIRYTGADPANEFVITF